MENDATNWTNRPAAPPAELTLASLERFLREWREMRRIPLSFALPPIDLNRIFNTPRIGGWEKTAAPAPEPRTYPLIDGASTYTVTTTGEQREAAGGMIYDRFALPDGEQVPCLNRRDRFNNCERWMQRGYSRSSAVDGFAVCETCFERTYTKE